jgi:hypothetical protein
LETNEEDVVHRRSTHSLFQLKAAESPRKTFKHLSCGANSHTHAPRHLHPSPSLLSVVIHQDLNPLRISRTSLSASDLISSPDQSEQIIEFSHMFTLVDSITASPEKQIN